VKPCDGQRIYLTGQQLARNVPQLEIHPAVIERDADGGGVKDDGWLKL
jgi:hypothetical protein